MPANVLRIISRESPLAVTQVDEALGVLRPRLDPSIQVERRTVTTPGDRDLSTPLTDSAIADDFFTRDIDQALLTGEADIAIHSAKDLPAELPPGLTIAALLPARDIRDALVFRRDWDPGVPPPVIGTSSPRREAFVRSRYPEAELRGIRGSIGQRIQQLDDGSYDAVIIAACALERLGLADRIGGYLPCDPEPDQGRLAITARREDREWVSLLRGVDVLRSAGLVALLDGGGHPSSYCGRIQAYLRQADVVMHPSTVAADDLVSQVRPGALRPIADDLPPSDLRRDLLHEAERGRFVVVLRPGLTDAGSSRMEDLDFLQAWGIRAVAVDASREDSPSSPTLFLGSDPTPFLRHGPFVHHPVIQLLPRPRTERTTILEDHLGSVDGVIFPSRTAVSAVVDALPHPAHEQLGGKTLLAVGPATAQALGEHGLRADLAPATLGGLHDLVQDLPNGLAGLYLYPCSDLSPQAKRRALLREHGIEILPQVFYRNLPGNPGPLPDVAFSRVLFTSASTADAYFALYPEEHMASRTWVALGPPTREALLAKGLESDLLPDPGR